MKLDSIRKTLTQSITQLHTHALEATQKAQYLGITNHHLIQGEQSIAFQNSFKAAMQRAYAWIKQEIPLIDFALSKLGWRLVKEKSTQKEVVLHHPTHGKILVPTQRNPRTGHWVYCSLTHQGGGTLLDLLWQAKWSCMAIKSLASSYPPFHEQHDASLSKPSKPLITAPKQQEAVAQAKLHAISNSQDNTYLHQRGIQTSTYQAFDQLRVTSYKAVFGLYKDFESQANGRLCSTITYQFDREGNRTKYFQKDLPRGLSVLKGHGPATTLVLTESPIDALSYRQLQLTKEPTACTASQYISTCGSLSVGIKQDLSKVFETAAKQGQQVILGMDKDQAGLRMTRALTKMLAAKGCSYRIAQPALGKDWNECLLQSHSAMHHAADPNSLAQQQCVDPTHACLSKVGIAEATYPNTGNEARLFGLYGELLTKYPQGLPLGLSVLKGHAPAKLVVTNSPLEALLARQGLLKSCHELERRCLEHQEQAIKHTAGYAAHASAACKEADEVAQQARELLEQTHQELSGTMFVSPCGGFCEDTPKKLVQVFDYAKANGQAIVLALDACNVQQVQGLLEGKNGAYSVNPCPSSLGLRGITYDLSMMALDNDPGNARDDDKVKRSQQKGRRMKR